MRSAFGVVVVALAACAAACGAADAERETYDSFADAERAGAVVRAVLEHGPAEVPADVVAGLPPAAARFLVGAVHDFAAPADGRPWAPEVLVALPPAKPAKDDARDVARFLVAYPDGAARRASSSCTRTAATAG